jgi:hypothetical protein
MKRPKARRQVFGLENSVLLLSAPHCGIQVLPIPLFLVSSENRVCSIAAAPEGEAMRSKVLSSVLALALLTLGGSVTPPGWARRHGHYRWPEW